MQQARCAKGWSIEQLSRRSGVPGRLIREIESRNSSSYVPSEANTILLGEALRTPVGLLLGQRERLFQQVYQLRLRANHPMAASSTLAFGVLIVFEAINFLCALTLMAVSSLRALYCLS